MKKIVYILFYGILGVATLPSCIPSCIPLGTKSSNSFDFYSNDNSHKGKLTISNGTLQSGKEVWIIKTPKIKIAVEKKGLPDGIRYTEGLSGNNIYQGYYGGLNDTDLRSCFVEMVVPMEVLLKNGVQKGLFSFMNEITISQSIHEPNTDASIWMILVLY